MKAKYLVIAGYGDGTQISSTTDTVGEARLSASRLVATYNQMYPGNMERPLVMIYEPSAIQMDPKAAQAVADLLNAG
jgi:phenylacetate-coenzyme A ligase PaaK-like adenylate-forming protein